MHKNQTKRRSGFDDPVGDVLKLSAGGKINKLLCDIHSRGAVFRKQPKQRAPDRGSRKRLSVGPSRWRASPRYLKPRTRPDLRR